MPAGLNVRIKIWRIVEQTDDEYGGAVVSGTVLHESMDARFQALKPSPLLLEQGLEVESLYRCMVRGSNLDLREYDEIEIIWPLQHKYHGDRFRIIKIQEDALHPLDRRNFAELTVSKLKYSRSNDLGEA